jgi:hypothetical protein
MERLKPASGLSKPVKEEEIEEEMFQRIKRHCRVACMSI